ncbi:MAG: HNH endonuclease signature motif containing protein [Rhodanobacter sp.]
MTAKRKAKGLTANGTPPVFAPPHIRFWEHVEKTGSCWLFKPAVEAERKYGNFFVSPQRKNVLAHRYSYEISIGPIPEGMTLDHLCEVTQCVNPEHLEPVTLGENLRRAHLAGDVCKNDHVYEEVGYFFTQEGWIVCKQCRKDSRARKAVSA